MLNRRGQSTVEYAVLGAVIIGALLAMQMYMKRSAMGRLRESSDQLGEQYNPFVHTATLNKDYSSTRTETTKTDGESTTTITSEKQATTGQEAIDGKLEFDVIFPKTKTE